MAEKPEPVQAAAPNTYLCFGKQLVAITNPVSSKSFEKKTRKKWPVFKIMSFLKRDLVFCPWILRSKLCHTYRTIFI